MAVCRVADAGCDLMGRQTAATPKGLRQGELPDIRWHHFNKRKGAAERLGNYSDPGRLTEVNAAPVECGTLGQESSSPLRHTI